MSEVPVEETPEQQVRNGLVAALVAYVLWGLLPLYFVTVRDVDTLEVLVHRVIWAVPFGALIIHFRHQWGEVRRAFTHRNMLAYLSVSALLIAGNWLVYILAVQNEQIFQASLGYYINPLLFAVAGVFLLDEKLRRPQMIAVLLAAIGVLVLTLSGGRFPAIALFLGVSFTFYGLIRKKVVIGGMPGLFVETVLIAVPALGYLLVLANQETAVFGADPTLSWILVLAGPITVIPLLAFALAARRLNLSTVGMLQFIAPTLQFAVGVYYGEKLTPAHVICFGCIWLAVALFSWDAWRNTRRKSVAA